MAASSAHPLKTAKSAAPTARYRRRLKTREAEQGWPPRHLAEYSDMEALYKRFPRANPAQLQKTADGERSRIRKQIDQLRAWAQERNLKLE